MSCSIAAVFFYARYTPRLTFTIPRHTFDDVGNCRSLRMIATAFYPLVVSDLQIVVLVWIRERFVSGGGLRTATALDCGETGIDTGLAVAALGVPGCGRLTATSHIVQRACSLPAGEIGVTASGYTLSQVALVIASGYMLSQVALVIASGHAGDYLPLLAARGQESQDGWPDVKHRRVLRRLSLSLLLFLKCRWQFFLRLEALFFIVTSVCSAGSYQVLFCACQDPLPGSVLRYCGWGCAVCWVWGPLCPSTSAAGAVTFGAATAMPAGAGGPPAPSAVPGVPGPMQRQVDFLSSGGRCRLSSGGFDWRDVSQVAVPFACGFFSSAGRFYRSPSVF